MASNPFERLPRKMVAVDPKADYYAVTLLTDENGRSQWSMISSWAGWSETKPPREMRKGAIVNPDRMISAWRELGQAWLVVGNREQFCLFILLGGHALVESEIAVEMLPNLVRPKPTVHAGFLRGWLGVATLPSQALNHAPTPKLRMEVLRRDRYRCRLCGRRPEDDVDVVLHVHHIRGWGGCHSGATLPRNLITLCETCHRGLTAAEELELATLVDPLDPVREADSFHTCVARHRTTMLEEFRAYAQEGRGTRGHGNQREAPRRGQV